VTRQYSRTLGKIANCQVAVSVHAVAEDASAVLDWRLFVPKSWDDTDDETAACGGLADVARTRRARAKIPEKERYRPQWQLALEMLDELASWGHRPPVVVADADYGQVAAFRAGLSDRDLRYVVATTATTTAHPVGAVPSASVQDPAQPGSGSGLRYPDRARTLAQHAQAAGQDATTRGHVMALRIRPAGKDVLPDDQGVLPEAWLIAEWPPDAQTPRDYWLSDLPADTPLDTLVRLTTIRRRIEHDYRELRTSLGLEHFEGRSWTGWNRHVTLVTAAHLFLTQWRRTHPQPSAQA
jgi:SRSO17 transposase